uniref:Ring finger protein n=1 Tax=Solanum tuberosum TaxID=4113 RepID=M0ZTR6_SOLTU
MIAVIVMGVVLLFIFLLVKIGQKWAIKRRGQATLRLFTRLPYSDIELGDRDTTCRICLSDFKSTDNIYILPCTHLYHSECISTWMRRQITCPTCRRNYGNIYTSWITCLVLFCFIILRTM